MTIQEIIERLEKRKGQDHEIETELSFILGGAPEGFQFDTERRCWKKYISQHDEVEFWPTPRYTVSLEAVTALLDRHLADCYYVIAKGKITPTEPLYGTQVLDEDGTVLGEAESEECLARAALMAFLKAFQLRKMSIQ